MREYIVERDMYVRYEGTFVTYKGTPCQVRNTEGTKLRLAPVWPGHELQNPWVNVTDANLDDTFPSPRYINFDGQAVWVYRAPVKTYRRAPTKMSLYATEAGCDVRVSVCDRLVATLLTADYPTVRQAYILLHGDWESVALSPERAAVVCQSGIAVLDRGIEIAVATSWEKFNEIVTSTP